MTIASTLYLLPLLLHLHKRHEAQQRTDEPFLVILVLVSMKYIPPEIIIGVCGSDPKSVYRLIIDQQTLRTGPLEIYGGPLL